MFIFSIADVKMSLVGEKSPLLDYLQATFQMCRVKYCQKAIPINVYWIEHPKKMKNFLPEWVVNRFKESHSEVLSVIQSEDQSGETASFINTDSIFACAWSSGTEDNLKMVSGVQPRGVPFKPPLIDILIPVLRQFLLNRGKFLFHCTAVTFSDDTAIGLLGDPGSGKTTTALSLLKLGASLLAHDRVVIERDNNSINLFGIPEPFGNIPKKFDFYFTETTKNLKLMPQLGVKAIPPQKIYEKDKIFHKRQLTYILFLNRTSDGPALEPITAQDALGKLISAHNFVKEQALSHASASILFDIIRHVSCFQVNTGSDPLSLGKMILNTLTK